MLACIVIVILVIVVWRTPRSIASLVARQSVLFDIHEASTTTMASQQLALWTVFGGKIDEFMAVNKVTAGRDKLYRVVQYFCR